MPRLALSLARLRDQVNAAAPRRSKKADGWIGDKAHAKRTSDHNPNARGVVQALDITHDPNNGMDAHALAETLRGFRDKRIKYVISNGRIFSGPAGVKPWIWRKYTGSNKHVAHVHVSVEDVASLYDDARDWNTGLKIPAPAPAKIFLARGPADPEESERAAAPRKTGISQGAKVAAGAGAVGVATQAWEAVSQAPETLLQAMLGALHKPAFWVFVVVIAAGVYVWHRRKQMKAAP